MLHSVAHATLSLRCIKVSREKSCNEQDARQDAPRAQQGFAVAQGLHLVCRILFLPLWYRVFRPLWPGRVWHENVPALTISGI